MATQKIRIGNIKGPQGERGKTGEQGIPGTAASVKVGAVTTSDYGSNAKVTNSGTSSAAVLDFQIPQGAPGETVTDVSELGAKSITASDAQFPTFTVGEKMKAVLGKIQKYLTDLKADVGQRLLATNVANNLATTVAGYALDARQGKALADKNASLENRITQLNGKLKVKEISGVINSDSFYVFYATEELNLGTIKIPRYSRGIHIGYGTNAAIIAVDYNGKFYHAYRVPEGWKTS